MQTLHPMYAGEDGKINENQRRQGTLGSLLLSGAL